MCYVVIYENGPCKRDGEMWKCIFCIKMREVSAQEGEMDESEREDQRRRVEISKEGIKEKGALRV